MKVILLKSVPKVGNRDQIVEVSEGYATNALFPRKLAVPATQAAIDSLTKKKQNAVAEKEIRKNLLERAVEEANGQHIELKVEANPEGGLYQKLDQKEIAKFLEANRISIDPSCVILPDGPIKKLGQYEITIKEGEYKASVSISIARKG